MKCVKPLAHRPEFEGKYNCKHCARDRLKLMENADEVAVKKGYEASATGMYLCEEFEGKHLIDRLNMNLTISVIQSSQQVMMEIVMIVGLIRDFMWRANYGFLLDTTR